MTDPSLQELLRDVIYKLAPSLVCAGVHSYTVTRNGADGRMDLAPALGVLHPPLLRVEQWAAPGIEASLNIGDKVLVAFVDNDAAQPVILGHLPLRDGKPAGLKIDFTGAVALAKAQQVADNFNTILTAITNATVTPGDGGATLKGDILTGLLGYPTWTGTTKVKGL